jgi:hypothetical protein
MEKPNLHEQTQPPLAELSAIVERLLDQRLYDEAAVRFTYCAPCLKR